MNILENLFSSSDFYFEYLVAGSVILEEVLHVALNLHLLGDVGLEELHNLLWWVALLAHFVAKLSSCINSLIKDHRTIGLSDYRIIGLSDYRIIGLSDYRNYRIMGLSDRMPLRCCVTLLAHFVAKLSSCINSPIKDYRIIGLSDYRIIGLSDRMPLLCCVALLAHVVTKLSSCKNSLIKDHRTIRLSDYQIMGLSDRMPLRCCVTLLAHVVT